MAKVVRFHELGGPEVLRLEEIDHSELITEMRLSGWTEKVIFSGSDVSNTSGQ